MTKEQQNYFLNLVSEGEDEKAINELRELNFKDSFKEEFTAIASQYQQLRQKRQRGILSAEQDKIQQNQIATRLIAFINQPKKPVLTTKTPKQLPIKPSFWNSKGIQFLGIFGSLASIIALYFVFFPPQTTDYLQLTVFVTDTNGNVVLENEGELNIPLGNRPLNAAIGEDGRTNFSDIPASLKGSMIKIGLDAKGWKIAQGNNQFIFDGKPIILEIIRDRSLCIIKGTVRNRNGVDFLANAMIRIGADTTIYANNEGTFRVVLPYRMCVKKNTDRYKIHASKDGYESDEQFYTPQSSPLDFRLIPKQ